MKKTGGLAARGKSVPLALSVLKRAHTALAEPVAPKLSHKTIFSTGWQGRRPWVLLFPQTGKARRRDFSAPDKNLPNRQVCDGAPSRA